MGNQICRDLNRSEYSKQTAAQRWTPSLSVLPLIRKLLLVNDLRTDVINECIIANALVDPSYRLLLRGASSFTARASMQPNRTEDIGTVRFAFRHLLGS